MEQYSQLVLRTMGWIEAGIQLRMRINGSYKTFTSVTSISAGMEKFQFRTHTELTEIIAYWCGNNYTVTEAFDIALYHITITAKFYRADLDFGIVEVTPENNYSLGINSQVDYTSPIVITPTVIHNYGNNTGSISLQITGGNPPYVYKWSGPNAYSASARDISGLASGLYTLEVWKGAEIAAMRQYTVESRTLAVEVDLTPSLCNSGATGRAVITVAGGQAPYTYEWSDGITDKDRVNLIGGNIYTLEVTDAAGASRTVDIEVPHPDPIVIVAVLDGKDVTLQVSGGTAPYSYAWADGPVTQNRTDLEPNSYTVTVTDANGCTKQATVEISPFTFYFSWNPILLRLAAADPVTKPNLTFLCEVWIERDYLSDTFEKVLTREQPADENGETVFDVQDVVSAYVEELLPDPEEGVVSITDHFRRFYLRYTEKYGEPPAEEGYIQQDTLYCLLGGLNEYEYARGKYFDNVLPTQKPFFSWWPTRKNIYPEQTEFLHYMVNSYETTELQLRVKFTYTDGSTSTIDRMNAIINPNRFEVYRFPVGCAALGTDSLPGEVAEYTVWVEDQNNEKISEERTFVVQDSHPRLRQFIYLNSLGGWDTLAVTERITGNMKTSADEISVQLAPGYAPTESSVKVLRKQGGQRYRYGFFVKNRQTEHLIDFALSTHVYQLLPNNQLLPVRIACDPDILDEIETFNEFSFDVLYPEITRYTPLL